MTTTLVYIYTYSIHIIQPSDTVINLSIHTPNYNPNPPALVIFNPLDRWSDIRPGDGIGVNVIHINTFKWKRCQVRDYILDYIVPCEKRKLPMLIIVRRKECDIIAQSWNTWTALTSSTVTLSFSYMYIFLYIIKRTNPIKLIYSNTNHPSSLSPNESIFKALCFRQWLGLRARGNHRNSIVGM